METHARRRAGFSLLEVTIVVAILGLLAAVVMPKFSSPSAESRTAAMAASLSTLRTAIDTYWSQHDGFPGPGAAKFADQLLGSTNKAGQVGSGPEFGFGPYLRDGQLPENPLTGSSTLKVVDEMPGQPAGGEAWMYCTQTGEIRSNTAGTAPDGTAYFEL